MLNLPAHARIWIFQADRFITDNEKELIDSEMAEFMGGWASHGNDLYGGFSVENDLFLMVGADESKSPNSGCSIDSLNRKIKEIGDNIEVNFFDRLQVAYEDDSTKIHVVPLGEFKKLMTSDTVNRQTTVYNNLIETVGDLDENWRTKVDNSWHKNLIEIL
jgi:hypothetical protein